MPVNLFGEFSKHRGKGSAWLFRSPRGDLGCLLEELWTAVSLAGSGMLLETPHRSACARVVGLRGRWHRRSCSPGPLERQPRAAWRNWGLEATSDLELCALQVALASGPGLRPQAQEHIRWEDNWAEQVLGLRTSCPGVWSFGGRPPLPVTLGSRKLGALGGCCLNHFPRWCQWPAC